MWKLMGVLSIIFGGAAAKVLDQAVYVGNMEQTIPMLAESTQLDYKTVREAVRHLHKLHLVRLGRRISNAQTYRFNVEGDLHELLSWIENPNLAKAIRRLNRTS